MKELTDFAAAIERLVKSNRQPAIEEPANAFETSVVEWAEFQSILQQIKAALKVIESEEREKRCALADSLRAYFSSSLKEGVNNYKLSNGRKLKFSHKIERRIDTSMVAVTREAYIAAGDADVPFDDLLRVKYEVDIRNFRKVTTAASQLALTRMITTTTPTPTLEVD